MKIKVIPPAEQIRYPILARVIEKCVNPELHLGDVVLLLGEISNMPDHLAFTNRSGKIFYGYHPENFRILSDEET